MDKKIINYEDVKSQTTSEYFENNDFSIDAFNSKYSLYEGETYVQSLKRVCDYIASVEETEELQEYWSSRWFDEVYNDWWHPAGSIMQGAGSGRKISLANCTTISLGTGREEEEWDSLEGIVRNCAYTVAKTAAYRQGLGVDFSRLRPRGSTVQNSANYSTGAIHWMEYIDKIGYFVGQQGRIPAMLFSISCSHPDVEEFIGIKADYSKIQNANISVQCTDDFYKAVEKGDDWVLNFSVPEVKVGDKVYVDCHSTGIDSLEDDKGWYYIAKKEKKAELITKTVKARDLLKLIAQNMFTNAEPGIQNIDIARRLSNSDYVYDPSSAYDSRIVSTNACSEQYLSRESLCVLASANAARFSTIEAEYEEELSVIGTSINRFLDNVNECELRYSTYATPHQRLAIEQLRRTGAGFTNVAGWLFKLNEKYGSEVGNKAIATFAERYNYYLYKGSIALGREKGSFQAFNRKKLEESPFIQHMMEKGLKFTALRNVTCSSIAPTGCTHEDTRIATNKGLVKIKDMIDDKPPVKEFSSEFADISALTESGLSKVKAFYNNGVVNGFMIKTEDGRSQRVSETHRFRVFNNEGKYIWKYAPEIVKGDMLVTVLDMEDILKDLPLVSLDSSLDSQHYNCKDCILPLELNADVARFMGIFTGDGSIKFKPDRETTESIRIPVYKEDEDLVTTICELTKRIFNVDCVVKEDSTKQMFEISIFSKNVAQFIINNGFAKKEKATGVCDCKSHIYHIPELIFKSNSKIVQAYLSGLFEADGSAFGNDIDFASKYLHIVEEVQELLISMGIQSFIREIDRSNDPAAFNDKMYHLNIRYSKDVLKFRDKIGFLSLRKRSVLDMAEYELDREPMWIPYSDAISARKNVADGYTSKSKLWARLNVAIFNSRKSGSNLVRINKKMYDEILDYCKFDEDIGFEFTQSIVKEVSREEFQTYDIEVESQTHSYITGNGFVNHNTLSLMFRGFVMSYGIEPAFGVYFWKRSRMSGKYEYYFCVPRVVRDYFRQQGLEIPMTSDTIKDTWDGEIGKPIVEFIDKHINDLGIKFAHPTEIKSMHKLDLMSKVMKDVDSSISVTYMLPEDTPIDDVYEFILESWRKGVKSIAAFPDKKMYGIISYMPFKELAVKLKEEGIQIDVQNFSDEELAQLHISKQNVVLNTQNAPKRNSVLDAEIYSVVVGGEKFVIVIGLQNGYPYEIFGGHMNGFGIKNKKCAGKISKVARGKYALEFGDVVIEDFSMQFTPVEQLLFRSVSLMMRHGIPIEFIVEQLQKATDDISSLAAATCRVMKKYVSDGQKVSGKVCVECGSELLYHDGCVKCTHCTWSLCS